MALSQNQPKVGHLRGTSGNKVAKTGRDAGLVGPATGKTERGKSTNPVSRSGSEPGRTIERGVGPRSTKKDLPSTSSIGDGVVR